MNVIVSNLNRDKFSNLGVDIIKSIDGEFDVEEIVQSFSNFFFNRMFLDITAIKDYKNFSNIQKLSMGLDVDKIIILLNDDPIVNSNIYLSKLVSMGIYNFAKNVDELMYLYNNPNSYKDVAHYQQIDNSIIDDVQDVSNELIVNNDVRVIGIKNITSHAGATSLIYMLKKILSNYYSVMAIEVNKSDFMFYNDEYMVAVNERDLANVILKYKDFNIILIDLNNLNDAICNNICTDILYLVEPSLFRINKLITLNREVFLKFNDERIVLNMSFFKKRKEEPESDAAKDSQVWVGYTDKTASGVTTHVADYLYVVDISDKADVGDDEDAAGEITVNSIGYDTSAKEFVVNVTTSVKIDLPASYTVEIKNANGDVVTTATTSISASKAANESFPVKAAYASPDGTGYFTATVTITDGSGNIIAQGTGTKPVV